MFLFMSTFTLQQPIEIEEQEWIIDPQEFTLNQSNPSKTITIDISKSGYTPIAISEYTLNLNDSYRSTTSYYYDWKIQFNESNINQVQIIFTSLGNAPDISQWQTPIIPYTTLAISSNSKFKVQYYKNTGVIFNVN